MREEWTYLVSDDVGCGDWASRNYRIFHLTWHMRCPFLFPSLEASTGSTEPKGGFTLGSNSNSEETLNSSDPIGQENCLPPKDYCTGSRSKV